MGIRVSAVVTLLWVAALAVPHAQQAPPAAPAFDPLVGSPCAPTTSLVMGSIATAMPNFFSAEIVTADKT